MPDYTKKIEVLDGDVWLRIYSPNNDRAYIKYWSIGPLDWRLKRAHKIADKFIKTLKDNNVSI